MHILLIKTSSMGDVIHALPAVSDAQRRIPNLSVDWVVEEGFAAMPRWHGAVDRVIVIALRRWRKNWWRAWRSGEIARFLRGLRATKYDYVIDAQGLCKSAVIARLARLADSAESRRCGYSFGAARESLAALFYQRRFKVPTDQHAITRIRQLFARVFDYELSLLDDVGSAPDYGIKGKIPLLRDLGNIGDFAARKYLVFVHGTSRSAKCWAEEKWVELARLASVAGFTVLLPWGNEEEKSRAERIAYACGKDAAVQVLPQLTLSAIAVIMQHASGVIAVDTGLGHLAAALEIPTVALYGATRSELVGVIGKRAVHINDMQSITANAVWYTFREVCGISGRE